MAEQDENLINVEIWKGGDEAHDILWAFLKEKGKFAHIYLAKAVAFYQTCIGTGKCIGYTNFENDYEKAYTKKLPKKRLEREIEHDVKEILNNAQKYFDEANKSHFLFRLGNGEFLHTREDSIFGNILIKCKEIKVLYETLLEKKGRKNGKQ